MRKLVLTLATLALTVMTVVADTPKGWSDDFEAAKKKAEKENKTMLVLFTGSDWCPWCVKLEREIISQKSFAKVATKEFVPVFLDFPQNESLVKPKVREQNETLARKYGIRGFPTLLVMDAKGEVKAKTGYRRGGPEAYVKHLRELSGVKAAEKGDEAKSEGAEKKAGDK